MKKILSITAVSAIATLTLSMGANAKDGCVCSFETYTNFIKNNVQCCHASITGNVFASTGDSVIDELLKDCETIYKDSCGFCNSGSEDTPTPERPGVPDNNDEDLIFPTPPVSPDNDNQSNIPSNNNGSADTNITKFKNELIALVNKERSENGLSALVATNTSLSKAADLRAKEQAKLFSHTRPNGSKWSTVLSEYSINYKTAGENVAYGQDTPAEVMKAWMNSSGHRANILNDRFTQIGVGVYYKNGTYYWSQIFIG